MSSHTVLQIIDNWAAFTQLSPELIHVYNIVHCPGCGNELMSKSNEYIELNEAAAGALVSLLKFHGMEEYDDSPEEIDWLGSMPLRLCEDCESTKDMALTQS